MVLIQVCLQIETLEWTHWICKIEQQHPWHNSALTWCLPWINKLIEDRVGCKDHMATEHHQYRRFTCTFQCHQAITIITIIEGHQIRMLHCQDGGVLCFLLPYQLCPIDIWDVEWPGIEGYASRVSSRKSTGPRSLDNHAFTGHRRPLKQYTPSSTGSAKQQFGKNVRWWNKQLWLPTCFAKWRAI